MSPLVSKNKNNIDYNDEEDESRSTSNFVPLQKATKDSNKKPILLEYNDKKVQSYREQKLIPPDSLDQQEKIFYQK